MNRNPAHEHRVLSIAPSTSGFGFAVLEDEETLVDWGVMSVKGDKNAQCLQKTGKLILQYRPDVLALQDYWAQGSRRSVRVRELGQRLVNLARDYGITTSLFSRERIHHAFLADSRGTKHALAEALARRFPEELGGRLPPKRRPWMSEDSRMSMFEAAALALMTRL